VSASVVYLQIVMGVSHIGTIFQCFSVCFFTFSKSPLSNKNVG